MPKVKSNSDFLAEVRDLVGDEYKFLEEYKGNKLKIMVSHQKCNYTYPVAPSKFLSGRRCPNCNGGISKTNEDFIKEVYSLVGDEYSVVGEYVNSQTHIAIIHNFCGEQYDVFPNNFVKKNNPTRCAYCYGNKKYKIDDIRLEFEKRKYILLEQEYIDVFGKLKYICLKHPEYEQIISYHGFNVGRKGCKYCGIESNSGENNWNWKGGITPIQNHLRRKIISWKLDSMQACNYCCVISGKTGQIEVHHLIPFKKIFKETFIKTGIPIYDEICKYSLKELEVLTSVLIDLHYRYGLGVCLSPDIHKHFHIIYGKLNNTPEQFEEFKHDYLNGKYKNVIAS